MYKNEILREEDSLLLCLQIFEFSVRHTYIFGD